MKIVCCTIPDRMQNTKTKCSLFLFLDFDNEVVSDNNDSTANDSSDMSDVLLNCTISDDEIQHAVKKLKNNKAPGYDEVLNEHISTTISIFLPLYRK